MSHTSHNPDNVVPAVGGYSHGVEVEAGAQYLYASGQIPETSDGEVPDGFEAQCEAVWTNIEAILASADMRVENLVKVTTFLTNREDAEMNSVVRRRHLGDHCPALTVVVVETLDPRWLLEIEAVAASRA